MRNEKSQELASDIRETVRDCTIEDAVNETERVVNKYRATTDNETLATIAQDAFCDYLDACDVPGSVDLFRVHFPALASYGAL
jgi:hypothetical protein